ncbi:hypothetical protein HYW82_00345 [Candidatus Peregrinibacteria bacterium]|nr:hypothetical protein [Candidatus Peregrinibacteria bacterium]
MKVRVVKDEKESNERLVSRFNKVVQASRKLVKIRDEQYYVHKPKKRKIRTSAIKRAEYRAAKEKSKFY